MQELGQEWTVWKSAIRFKELSAAPNTASTMPANTVSVYAKDKSGTSALYLMDDSGNEREVGPANAVTGTGTANRLAYWSSSSVLAANAALTQNRVMFPDSNGLPTGDSNFNWDDTNKDLVIGNSIIPDTALAGRKFAVVKSGAIAEVTCATFGVSSTTSGFRGITARGTVTVPTATQADDGTFIALEGHTGSAYTAGRALITLKAGENYSPTAQSSYITFETTALATTTRAERFRIGPSGQWGIGGATYGTAGQYFRSGGASAAPTWATIDHGSEVGGLSDDDHTIYALLAGRSGGQTLIGGTAAADKLTLRATAGVGAGSEAFIFQLGNNGATEGMRITGGSTGRVGIGLTAPAHLLHLRFNNTVGTRAFGAEGDGTAANASFETYVASTAASTFIFRKGRGTVASPGQTLSNDSLMTFVARAVDNTPALTGDMAKFEIKATENVTTTGHGSRISWTVVPNGSTSQVESVLFPEDGGIAVKDGITAPAALTGWAKIYVDSGDGALKVRFGDGSIVTIVSNPP